MKDCLSVRSAEKFLTLVFDVSITLINSILLRILPGVGVSFFIFSRSFPHLHWAGVLVFLPLLQVYGHWQWQSTIDGLSSVVVHPLVLSSLSYIKNGWSVKDPKWSLLDTPSSEHSQSLQIAWWWSSGHCSPSAAVDASLPHFDGADSRFLDCLHCFVSAHNGHHTHSAVSNRLRILVLQGCSFFAMSVSSDQCAIWIFRTRESHLPPDLLECLSFVVVNPLDLCWSWKWYVADGCSSAAEFFSVIICEYSLSTHWTDIVIRLSSHHFEQSTCLWSFHLPTHDKYSALYIVLVG